MGFAARIDEEWAMAYKLKKYFMIALLTLKQNSALGIYLDAYVVLNFSAKILRDVVDKGCNGGDRVRQF
jgi:hypothetical protein